MAIFNAPLPRHPPTEWAQGHAHIQFEIIYVEEEAEKSSKEKKVRRRKKVEHFFSKWFRVIEIVLHSLKYTFKEP